MSERLEQIVRDIYTEDAAGYDDDAPALMRLRAFDYRRRTERHRKRSAAVGASGTGVVLGVIAAVVLLLSSGTPAYAGWSPDPTTASDSAVAASSAACDRVGRMSAVAWAGEHVFSGHPVLTERRGIYTAAIYVTDGSVYACLTGSATEHFDRDYSITSQLYGPLAGSPRPDQLGVPYLLQQSMWQGNHNGQLPLSQLSLARRRHVLSRDMGGGYGRSALGQAGAGVTAVTFNFAAGNTVSATVENGWYFAWWPWLEEPTSVQVTIGSGTLTSPMVGRRPYTGAGAYPRCQPGSADCAFGATPRQASQDSAP